MTPQPHARVVYQCCITRPYKIEQRHESIDAAARALGVTPTAIRTALAWRTRCGGWYWRSDLSPDWRPAKRRRVYPVMVIDRGRRMRCTSIADAAAVLGMSRRQIEERMCRCVGGVRVKRVVA